MESREQVLKEKLLTTCLHLATTRVKDVERERTWAIAAGELLTVFERTLVAWLLVLGIIVTGIIYIIHRLYLSQLSSQSHARANRLPELKNNL